MPSSTSHFSSLDACSSGGSGNSSGWSQVNETLLLDTIIIALKAFQTFIEGLGVGSSRCPNRLGYATLRVESLRPKSLARPSILSKGHSWGLLNLCLSSIPPQWYPHISETFTFLSSYQLRVMMTWKPFCRVHTMIIFLCTLMPSRLDLSFHYTPSLSSFSIRPISPLHNFRPTLGLS